MIVQYDEGTRSMGELVEASGVHRQTIHGYLRSGLLPPPLSGGGTRNARYGAVHLELLGLLRELRDDRGMSLAAIGRVFLRADHDPARVRDALAERHAPAVPRLLDADRRRLTPAEVARAAEAPISLLETLAAADVLPHLPEDAAQRRTSDAVSILAAARRVEQTGVPRDMIARVGVHASRLAAAEAALLAADAADDPRSVEAPIARAEGRFGPLGDLITAVRIDALRRVARRLEEVGPRPMAFAREAIYVPSALFITRHGLDAHVDAAEAEAMAAPGDAGPACRLGRLLLGLGRYDEAAHWLARAASAAPGDAEPVAFLGLAHGIPGSAVAGVRACERAVELAPESPRVHAFLAAVLGLLAATTAGTGEGGDVLRRALASAATSRGLEPADRREDIEVRLARGRLSTVLPRASAPHRDGVADLEEVLVASSGPGELVEEDYPGTRDVYRIHALFYLGTCAWQDERPDDARRMLATCIGLDPLSRFAQRAFEILTRIRKRG